MSWYKFQLKMELLDLRRCAFDILIDFARLPSRSRAIGTPTKRTKERGSSKL